MRAPVIAGVVVFVVAVIVAIGVAVTASLGASLPGGGESAGGLHASGVGAGGVETSGNGSGGGGSGGGGSGGGGSGGGGPGAANAEVAAEGAGASSTAIFVHVVGEVAQAGVVELAPGARVQDALEAAGGATDKAVLEGINLARAVVDGEQLVVPNAEAVAAGAGAGAGSGSGTGAEPGAGGGTNGGTSGSGSGAASQIVNINTADAVLLETLPRVGPALAGRIIDWREQNGGFASVDQLLEVTGIGVKTLEGFREQVTV